MNYYGNNDYRDYLMHAEHKYVSRVFKNGKWYYTYAKDSVGTAAANARSGAYNGVKNVRQLHSSRVGASGNHLIGRGYAVENTSSKNANDLGKVQYKNNVNKTAVKSNKLFTSKTRTSDGKVNSSTNAGVTTNSKNYNETINVGRLDQGINKGLSRVERALDPTAAKARKTMREKEKAKKKRANKAAYTKKKNAFMRNN